jgi:hypothetical protein
MVENMKISEDDLRKGEHPFDYWVVTDQRDQLVVDDDE